MLEGGWWSVPGPARYLDAVEEHLGDGRAVVLVHPHRFAGSLRDAVERRVTAGERWSWRALDFEGTGGEDPAGALVRRLVVGPDGPASVSRLLESESCRDVVVWVEGLGERWWPEWVRFLVDYDRQARNAAVDHLLLCVDLDRERALWELPRLAAVALCLWSRVVEREDTALFVARGMPSGGEATLLKSVKIALCTELAGTDGELASELVGLDLETLVAPMAWLRERAHIRGVRVLGTGRGAWRSGEWEYWDGEWRLTSCVAASGGQQREVVRRVWKAQVGVVFPFVEERRIELVEALRPIVRLPVDTGYGVVHDAAELEIGQLRQCARNHGVRGPVRRSVELLADIRHALAHLEPVSAVQLREAARVQARESA